MPRPKKLQACCTNPKCDVYHGVVEFLRLWGLDPQPKKDGRIFYFDITPPSYWNEFRLKRYQVALRQLATEH